MEENEKILAGALLEDEKVVWKGSPAPYKLLDEDNKKGTLVFWIIAIAIAGGLSALYTVYIITSGGGLTEIKPIVFVFTIGFPLIVFVDPIRDKSHIGKQLFAITDRRVLIVHKNTNNENKALVYWFSDMDSVRIDTVCEGFSRIRFCSATFEAQNLKLRRAAIMGAFDKNEKLAGLVFYKIADSELGIISSALSDKVAIAPPA